MILGIGTDIVEIKHFKTALKKTPSLLKRLFTKNEQKRALTLSDNKKLAYYAKRFAAKEAISKACGTGIGNQVGWLDIEISNDSKGAPRAKLNKTVNAFLQKKFKTSATEILLSLSDEKDYVIAFAILKEKK